MGLCFLYNSLYCSSMLYDMILKFQGKRFISEFAPMIKNVLFSLMYDFPIP